MGSRAYIWIVGSGAAAIAYYNEASTVAAVFLVGTALFTAVHHLEVKVNKLLDYHGIHVSQEDLRD